jgi:hypothetical protein
MKNLYKRSLASLLKIIATVAVIAAASTLAGCDNGTNTNGTNTNGTNTNETYDGPKSFKVTGINKPDIKSNANVDIISGDNNLPANGQVATGNGEIVEQALSVDLYSWTSDNETNEEQPWAGNGSWTIRLKLFDNDNNKFYDYFWKGGQKYDIKDAVTTLRFADFDLVYTGEMH